MSLTKATYSMIDGAPINVLDYGADPTGVADSSTAIQNAINACGNNGSVFIPDGTYKAENIYIDFDNIQIDCRGVFDMTGKSNPLFILGQQANGSASAAARININIRGLATTGDRTSGSKAVYFRRCSTSKLVDCRLWALDTAFNGEGYPGFTYESLICEFHNLDIRQCNVGINDVLGSFQASTFFHGRIENNQNEGVISNSPNISFIGTTIEGNNESTTAKPEIKWGSYGGALNLTNCYVECVRNATTAIEVVTGTGSGALTISGGSYFLNDAANRYLVTTARTSLSLTVIGGLYSSFKNWLSGTISGDYSVMIRPAFTNVDPLITANTTFSSGAAFYQYRRDSGLVTNKNISVAGLLASSNLSLQGGFEKTFYVNGNNSGTQTVVPVVQFSGTTTYLVEVVGVGRNGAATSGGFKMYVLRNGDGSIANYSVDYANGATATSLVAANNAGNLEIQALLTSASWNFFSFLRGRI